MSPGFFQDDDEKKLHEQAISSLCQQYPGRQDFIRQRYLEKLKPMISDARIRTYLPILVSRKIRVMLAGAAEFRP